MIRRTVLLLLALLMALTAMPPVSPTHAAHGISLDLFDRTSIGWFSVRNMSVADHQDFFESTAAQGYMMIDAERHEINGQLRVSSVWQRNSDGRGWVSRSNLTSQEFGEVWDQYRREGFRLIDQDVYSVGGALRYAGIWIENKENLAWASLRNLTSEEFSAAFDDYRQRGLMLIDTEAYNTADGLRYSQIWVENKENLAWIALRNMTSTEYANAFDRYAAEGFRVHDIESYLTSGGQRYAAIWFKNTNGRGWYAYRDMTAKQYGDTWIKLRDEGYRLTDFEVYDTASGPRYAGVWRQNSDRPNWRMRDDVTTLIERHMRENRVAGMSVSISVGNQIVYLRGFGHANIAQDRPFHSGTIARVASGCKAVAGALALRMEQTTAFDIDNATRFYAPTLPALHTHSVAQLLSSRGGVRHYNEGADATKNVQVQYNTALDAAQLFWNDPLAHAPGAGYTYSTHGYTLAAAAMEGFLNAPIAQILNQRLSQPFGLPTLQAENRSLPNPQRATLYRGTAGAPETVIPDNISWKVLGGGCEVSGYDYVRFGMKLVNGSILNAANLNRLWTRPDNQSNYALGWSTGTDQGNRVVAKSGGQLGASSYIRIYPDRAIVIAILSNQRGHDTVQLGRDIGTLLLNAGIGANGMAAVDPAEASDGLNQIIAPAQDEEIAEPQAELGDPFFGEPLQVLLPPTATDDSTEPIVAPFAEGGQPEMTVFMPLLLR